MNRRLFIKRLVQTGTVSSVASVAGCQYLFNGSFRNPCLSAEIPQALVENPLMTKALDGIDLSKLWDCHFHLVGNGETAAIDSQPSGVWVNSKMQSWRNPTQRIQYGFYLNASCIEEPKLADSQYMLRVNHLLNQSPQSVKVMLLAFDYHHNDRGEQDKNLSTFYVPNEYAARLAKMNPRLEWIASVHPYREDAIEALEWCHQNGAKAIKWLPPAMNIDPGSARLASFYDKLVALNMPLLTHAGDEKAVHGEEYQNLANPLKLRVPLERGVKVIVAHCASLGENVDTESPSGRKSSNFELFTRLMNTPEYRTNLLGDISAINLVNREPEDIKKLLSNQEWHERLLYASDYPLPGVMPIISPRLLARQGLIESEAVSFLNQVREHNAWLFDLLVKRLMSHQGAKFQPSVFETSRHFS